MFFPLKELILIMLFLASNAFAGTPEKVFISVDSDTLSILKKEKFISSVEKSSGPISVVEVRAF